MLKIDTELLGRPLRVDEPIEELGISSYDRLREAVKSGDTGTALALIDYVQIEGKGLHDLYCDWVYGLLTWIADNCGEERLPEVLAYSKDKINAVFLNQLKGLKTKKQLVQWYAEQMRAHRSGPGEQGNITVLEEQDRFVISLDPCGAGGRMRRGGEVDGTPREPSPPSIWVQPGRPIRGHGARRTSPTTVCTALSGTSSSRCRQRVCRHGW